MKLKAIVYDTTNGKARQITVRNVYCDKNGKPRRIGSQNGLQYKEFELIDEDSPKTGQTEIDYEV